MSSIRNNSVWANKIKVAQCVSRERKLTLSELGLWTALKGLRDWSKIIIIPIRQLHMSLYKNKFFFNFLQNSFILL